MKEYKKKKLAFNYKYLLNDKHTQAILFWCHILVILRFECECQSWMNSLWSNINKTILCWRRHLNIVTMLCLSIFYLCTVPKIWYFVPIKVKWERQKEKQKLKSAKRISSLAVQYLSYDSYIRISLKSCLKYNENEFKNKVW